MKKTTPLLFFIIIFSTLGLTQNQTVGLFTYEPETYGGYTLFNPLRATSVFLIDNCGRVINQWDSDYLPGQSSYLLEDGTLLRTAKTSNNSNTTFNSGGAGERVQLLDWENNLLWEYVYSNNQYRMHHDIEPLPNGNVLILAWVLHNTAESIAAGRDPNLIPEGAVWSEQIIEIQPEGSSGGTIVWQWDIWDHLIQDFDDTKDNFGVVEDHPELLDINYISDIGVPGEADWLHINAIDYNAQLDQIIMSSPSTNEIYIIDHSTTTAEAASHSGGQSGKGGDLLYRWGNPQVYRRGGINDQQIFAVHDVRWIEEGLVDGGKIMFFNNGRNRPDGDYSSVDIISPPIDGDGNYMLQSGTSFEPSAPFWSYSDPENFYSSFISGAQRLPNGNTLICSGGTGEFFEINPDQTTVWKYINPVINDTFISQGNPVPPAAANNSNMTFRCTRYPINYSGFDNKDLTPGNLLEVNPLPENLNCNFITSVQKPESEPASFHPNPTKEFIYFQGIHTPSFSVQIFNTSGQVVLQKNISNPSLPLNISQLAPGNYFITIDQRYSQKLIILQ